MEFRSQPESAASCPCAQTDSRGRALSYEQCCGRYVDHFADTPAPDAQFLMRSRYTAFATGATDYLLATWHPDSRPSDVDMPPGMKWLGLEVLRFRNSGPDHAEVEFMARYSLNGRTARLRELSRFLRMDSRWYYRDGDIR